MSEITVAPVAGRADLREFIMLPFRLYADVDQWVPPLISERKRHLDRGHNPYFEHAEAEYFLARRDGRVVGRISAQVDQRFNEFQKNDWGQFGFFESEDDPAIAKTLLDAAFAWLRERDRDHAIGPLDFSTNHECGLLVAGHELRPQILENWHHPYYATLLEGQGLTKAMDLYKWSLHVTGRTEVMPVLFELAEKLEPEHGITIRGMRRNDLNGEIARFMEIYNAAWEKNWGFVPMTRDELVHMAKDLKPLIDPNLAFVAEVNGTPVGVMINLLDYARAQIDIPNGRLFPTGFLKLLSAKRKLKTGRMMVMGIKAEHRTRAILPLFIHELYRRAEAMNAEGGEASWILEDNLQMVRAMESMGARLYRKWRIYDRPIR